MSPLTSAPPRASSRSCTGSPDVDGDTTARYVAPPREDLTPAQADLYDAITQGPRAQQSAVIPVVDDDGRLLGPFGLMTISPRLGEAVQALGSAIRFQGDLATIEREAGILVVAAHHRCDFEWFAHVGAARAAGLSEDQIAALHAGNVPDGVDERVAAVCRAVRMLMTGGGLADAAYRDATAALGEQGLAELVWLCGYYGMLAVALATFDPELPSAARGAFTRTA